MSVLDELRNELRGVVTWRGAGESMYYLDDVHRILDAFEAAHPGLIDKTHNCANCGLALSNYYEDGSGGPVNNLGWNYVWTFKGPTWMEPGWVDDEELYDIWLCCPACAKEAE